MMRTSARRLNLMLRIAVAQTPGTRLAQWRETREMIGQMIARAAGRQADVVVLPECVWPAYIMPSVDDYFRACGAGLPDDRDFLEQLAGLARAHRIAVCAGYVAQQQRRLFNAAVLISAAGEVLGTHRKCFLWDFDHTLFEPGDSLAPIDTEWGPIGLMICADARLPEMPATLVARGARLILQPTAWVNCGTPEELWNPQPELLVPERAREFGVPIASASKWGVEGQTTFVGSSVICDGAGNTPARCGTSETDVVVADVELEATRPVELRSRLRSRLLGVQPATMPTKDVQPLRVMYAREAALPGISKDEGGRMRRQGRAMTTLYVGPGSLPSSPPAGAVCGEDRLHLARPSGAIHTIRAVRVGAVRDSDADGFGPIRVLALDGVHVVVVFGERIAARALRTRAAENRIFVVQVTSSGMVAYDPCGQPLDPTSVDKADRSGANQAAEVLMLDVAESANKEFAPQTDPFAARTPELYEF
jgi:predicted amidohydrolase